MGRTVPPTQQKITTTKDDSHIPHIHTRETESQKQARKSKQKTATKERVDAGALRDSDFPLLSKKNRPQTQHKPNVTVTQKEANKSEEKTKIGGKVLMASIGVLDHKSKKKFMLKMHS